MKHELAMVAWLVLICLGGNDMLRGLPPAQTRANLAAIPCNCSSGTFRAQAIGGTVVATLRIAI